MRVLAVELLVLHLGRNVVLDNLFKGLLELLEGLLVTLKGLHVGAGCAGDGAMGSAIFVPDCNKPNQHE